MFRSRYNLLPHVPAVLDLVLLDDKNPRSVLFQINQLARHFDHLPREARDLPGSGQSLVQACRARLSRTDARELAIPREDQADSQVRAAIILWRCEDNRCQPNPLLHFIRQAGIHQQLRLKQ